MPGREIRSCFDGSSGTSGVVRKALHDVIVRILPVSFPRGFPLFLHPCQGTPEKRRRPISGCFIAALALAVLAAPLPAAGAGPDHDAIPEDPLERDDAGRSYQEYCDLFREDPGNPDINFGLGRAAFAAGDLEAAVMAFERVLMARPDTARVKLELARCYFHMGSLETAGRYFEEVLASNPPVQVRANIDRYLAAIRSSKREHFFSGRVSLGMDFDDNANAAPASSSIEITDLLGNVFPVTVDGAQSDQIKTGTARVDYLYKPLDGAVGWKVSALNYNALYRDVRDLDVNLFDIKAGVCIESGGTVWDVYGLVNHLNLDYDQYLRSYGTGASLSLVLSTRAMLNADARYRRKNYHDLSGRDADSFSVTLSPAFAVGTGHASLQTGWECERAEEDVYTYTRLNGIAGYQVSLPWSVDAYASYWYQGTQYEDTYPLFGRKRSDDVQYFTIGLSRTLRRDGSPGAGVTLGVGYTYTRSDSTIDLYTYTKNVTSVSVTFAF